MDVWNIFSIERRSAFLRFRLVDDDVLSGEKRSSMVDSEDFGEEDIAPKRVPPSASDKRTSPRGRQETSSQHNKGRRGRKERENDWRFFCFFFSSQIANDKRREKVISLLSLQKVI